ncbi:MAG: chromosome segregation protein SMC [Desulfarculaceae bacterium]|nr:chromosome segregation protein SMC [Desulfarculaceae bacterium]
MKVRRLDIIGFKSFADRTLMDIPEGLCAVVGPNGCGKSNVVDAVRWALGEQSAKQLRGSSMEDVIFNGADNRKPAGMAEVNIVFENDGSVTAEPYAGLAEIAVTRRLYRNGDSEYLINKMPCRLKDIQQVLMDTGLGNRAYAIIEQGRVGAFIEAKPEERRLWVEEAAGITRYKNQKKVSLRKMQGTKDNLNRLDDILAEVATQMERLKRQAKKAQRHKELRDQIRVLDLNVSSFEYRQFTEEISEVSAEAEAAGTSLELAGQRLAALEADLETARLELLEAEEEIRDSGARRLEAQGAIQKAENELILLGREAENLKRQSERLEAERVELKGSLAAGQEELNQARRVLASAEGGKRESELMVGEASQAVAARMEALATAEESVDLAKAELVDAMSRLSQIKNRLGDLERRRADLKRRASQQEEQRGQQATQEAEARQALEARRGEAERLRETLEEAAADLARGKARFKELTTELAALRRAEDEATRRRYDLSAAVDSMALSLESHDWAGDGVRKVLEAAAQGGPPSAVLGVVAEKLNVQPGREDLVESVLGPDLQAVVVADGEQALALAAWAGEKGLGRLRVVALAELAGGGWSAPRQAQPLAGLTKPEPGFEPLLHLLAGAGWCPDLESAWQAGRSLAPGQVVVSPGGKRLDRPGLATVGGGVSDSVLTRRNELAARREELAKAEQEAEAATQRRRNGEAELAEAEVEVSVLAEEQQARQDELARLERDLARSEQEAAGARRRLEALQFESDETVGELRHLEAEADNLSAQADALSGRDAELEEALEMAREELQLSRAELEEARHAEGEVKLAAQAKANQSDQAQREANRLQQELDRSTARLLALGRELEQTAATLTEVTTRRGKEQEGLGGLYAELDRQEAGLKRAQDVLGQAQSRTGQLEGELKRARAELKQAENSNQELAWRRRELELKREQVAEQTMERCRVELAARYREFLPEDKFDLPGGKEKLERLRKRLNRLGPVNLEAISEHAALEERHTFLSEQRADLEASLEDLRSAIRKINRTTRGRFLETLEEVNKRLDGVFQVLFGGGSAQLVLEEGLDPLEAGLHLMVELPGKKVKNLDSLSGGEKAMSAVAVLFALFLIRPAPFCILDEVDAPLDEANTGRFLDLLQQLSRRSQILMITHSRSSMELMGTLYGVTMEQKGVSKVLSVTLEQGESLAA